MSFVYEVVFDVRIVSWSTHKAISIRIRINHLFTIPKRWFLELDIELDSTVVTLRKPVDLVRTTLKSKFRG